MRGLKIGKFEQSIFITKDNKNLAYLEVADRDGCNGWSLTVMIGDEVAVERITYPYTVNTVALLLPVVKEETVATVCLEPFLERKELFQVILKPVQEIQIMLLSSSHEDLGYCAYVNELGLSCTDYINRALDIAERRSDYKYMIEHYWMLDAFDTYADENDKQRLKKYFAQGNIGLGAAFCGVHTAWQSKEQLIRSMWYATHACKEKWGISPKSVVYTDISGISSSAISAYCGCGIQYAAILENKGFRSRPGVYRFPPLFHWKPARGEDTLLCWHQIGYSPLEFEAIWKQDNHFVFDETRIFETEQILNRYVKEHFGGYRVVPISFYHDRELPSIYLADICAKLNGKWKSPHCCVALPDEIFAMIEKEEGDSLPVLRGELADQWADFATISSNWMGRKRDTQNRIREAEALATVHAIQTGSAYPQGKIDDIYWKMSEFDEHCWATSAKNPQKMHIFNMKLMKEQNALLAQNATEQLIARGIGTPDENTVSLWNFIPRKSWRGAILKHALQGISCQMVREGEIITEPIAMDGFSGKKFHIDQAEPSSAVQLHDTEIDTGMFRISCDYETGNITGIVDKETGKELLDPYAEYKLGDFIYVHDSNAKLTLKDEIVADLHFDVAKTRHFHVEQGDVATVVKKTAYEEQLCANVSMTLIFYKREKNIDVKLEFKNASSMMGSQLDRYKKNIFFAFPFSVDAFQFYTQTAADVLAEPEDRLKNAPHDFVMAENWIAVAGKDAGIALYAKEMPVFHLGGIHYDALSCNVEHRTSHVFLYAASNRCNQLVYRTLEDCSGTFHLSIFPYYGNFDSARLNAWCEEKNHPLMLGKGEVFDSRIEIDNPYISLCALKKANESGKVVLRFYNESMAEQSFCVTLPFTVKSAVYSSLNEDVISGALDTTDGCSLSLKVGGIGYVTVLADTGAEIQTEPARVEPYVDEIFWFVVENSKTVICFKKHNCQTVKEFKVYLNGILAATLPNEAAAVQFCELEGIGVNIAEIKMVDTKK